MAVDEATPADARAVCRVCRAGWRDAYDGLLPEPYVEANLREFYRPARIEREIREASPWNRWLLARIDGRIVGAARGNRAEPGVGELFNCYVHPEAQGEGVGTRLLESISDAQRSRGATEQVVAVFAPNAAAIGFYESLGFRAVERRPAVSVDGVDPGCETVRLRRDL